LVETVDVVALMKAIALKAVICLRLGRPSGMTGIALALASVIYFIAGPYLGVMGRIIWQLGTPWTCLPDSLS
jgi:hypothetical protein